MSWLRDKLTYPVRVLRNFFDNNTSLQAWLIAIPYVVAGVAAAVSIVLYGKLFSFVEDHAFSIYQKSHWWFLLLTPAMFYLGWLIVRYGAKGATGSGIPQIMASLKILHEHPHVSIRPLLSLKVIVVKVLSSVIALFGGAAIGREGPSLQLAASLYIIVHRLKPKSWPTVNRQKMIVAGAAAGLGAAFNTPLGGIVFAIEELSKSSIHSFRSSLLLSVILAGLTTQWLSGPYLYLGYPKVSSLLPSYFILLFVMAVIAGMAGAFKSRIILELGAIKKRFTKEWQHHLYVIFSGVFMAALIVGIGMNAMSSGKLQMQELLFSNNYDLDWTLIPARFFSSIVSFSSGVAGGVFAPSLATGAAIGAFFDHFTNFDANNKIIILCGMVAFLTGVTRAPFTSAVLVLEMTDRHGAIFPMMLSAMVANTAAAFVMKKSLYDYLMNNYMPEPAAHQQQHATSG